MSADAPVIGYVLKMYPRFSETFVVSEILAREAQGERIVIFSLRPCTDARFHPALARVQAPVVHIGRPTSPTRLWATLARTGGDPRLAPGLSAALPELLAHGHDDAVQAAEVAVHATLHGVTHLHAHFASVATTVARLAGKITGLPYSFTAHAKDIFHQDVDEADLARKLADAHHAVTISEYNRRDLRRRFPAAVDRLDLVHNGLHLDRFGFAPRPGIPAPDAATARSVGTVSTSATGSVGTVSTSATGSVGTVSAGTAPPIPPAGVSSADGMTPDAGRRPVRLLGVGRLVEKKGFALLVQAVVRLRERGLAVIAEIAGDGPLRDELAAQAQALGVGDAVRLLGPVTQAEVAELLGTRDLFVAPFVVGADGNADGLPTVLLEAMARGIPCIAADVTAVPEVIVTGRTGWLVPTGDVDALVDAIAEAARPGADHSALLTRARRLVEATFDSRRQAARLRELTARPAGPAASARLADDDLLTLGGTR